MHILVCLDNRNGMLFAGRRQSMDSAVRGRILQLAGENRLWMNAYTAKQFPELPGNVCVDDAFMCKAGQGDYCFVENTDVCPFLDGVEHLVLYRWNRDYPSDVKFPMHLFGDKWMCKSKIDFAGTSHDVITEEIYTL